MVTRQASRITLEQMVGSEEVERIKNGFPDINPDCPEQSVMNTRAYMFRVLRRVVNTAYTSGLQAGRHDGYAIGFGEGERAGEKNMLIKELIGALGLVTVGAGAYVCIQYGPLPIAAAAGAVGLVEYAIDKRFRNAVNRELGCYLGIAINGAEYLLAGATAAGAKVLREIFAFGENRAEDLMEYSTPFKEHSAGRIAHYASSSRVLSQFVRPNPGRTS